jgi:hypothetical protein
MFVKGSGAMTTAAAWIDELRTIPSRPCATSMICFACWSSATARARSSPGFRQSSNEGGRPMIGSGISFARRSPVP